MTGSPPLLTVGHGTLDADAFVDLLVGAGVSAVVDVRRFPGSRRHPHFASDALERRLADDGIGYRWEQRLGGRRHLPAAERGADPWWNVAAFAAYAAHTRSPEYREALDELLAEVAVGPGPTTVMCSESLWWRCHRRLVADTAVLLHGRPVLHLAHSGKLTEHRPAAGARRTAEGLRYDVVTDEA